MATEPKRLKRLRDTNKLAKLMTDILTGTSQASSQSAGAWDSER